MGYIYKDIPLTSRIAYNLILDCFPGKNISREDILNKICELHVSRGGKPAKEEMTAVVSGALKILQQDDLASPVVTGYWRILPKEIGSGESTVYVYYYPTFKDNAIKEGKDFWKCKVGKTTKDADSRIKEQTGIPEPPETGLEIKTDDPDQLENALHAMLKARGRHVEEAKGKEWFITSPTEVYKMYCLLTYFPKLLE
jgi:hypothetical protein